MVARILARVAPVVVGAVAAALLAASQLSLLTLTKEQSLACIVAVAASAIVGPFLPDLTESTRLRRQQNVSISLRLSLAAVLSNCTVSWNGVGAHFFIVRRWPMVSRQRTWPFLRFQRQLVDVGHERFDKVAETSAIKFTKGKGVVGACWQRGKNTFLDLTTHFGPYLPLTKAGWEQPGVDTLGLSWEEYEATAGIQVIAAFVAKGKGRGVAGVLTIEAPEQTLADPPVRTVDCLQNEETGRYIGGLADAIADKLGR